MIWLKIPYHIAHIKRTNASFTTYYPRRNGWPEIRSQIQVKLSYICENHFVSELSKLLRNNFIAEQNQTSKNRLSEKSRKYEFWELLVLDKFADFDSVWSGFTKYSHGAKRPFGVWWTLVLAEPRQSTRAIRWFHSHRQWKNHGLNNCLSL